MLLIDNANEMDFDSVQVDPFWNLGESKELKMHRTHTYPAKFPAFITTKALDYARKNSIKWASREVGMVRSCLCTLLCMRLVHRFCSRIARTCLRRLLMLNRGFDGLGCWLSLNEPSSAWPYTSSVDTWTSLALLLCLLRDSKRVNVPMVLFWRNV